MKWCNEDRFVSFLELQKEKKTLQEQILSAGKMSEENTKQKHNLEREKERLLSELVQSSSQKEEDMKNMKEFYESLLNRLAGEAEIVKKDLCVIEAEADERKKDVQETSQINICLKQQLQEAQSIISEKEQNIAQIAGEKTSLEADLKMAAEARKSLMERNESLIDLVMQMESETAPLKIQLLELKEQCERKVHFRGIFADLEHRIVNLKLKQEEITADKNVQLERIDTIAEQLSNLDVEAQKLHWERKDVAAICDEQENELAETVDSLMSLKEELKKNYLMLSDTHDGPSEESLEATVNELKTFVESSKMRISDIDQRMKEVEEEKSVLMQQQSHALERKNEYVNC
jgi:hypothetical protein